jgi:hypothetical protein
MNDLPAVLGDAAAVIDPKGENEEISVLCGLVAWAMEHPDQYDGWTVKTLSAAIQWTFRTDAEEAGEMANQLVDAAG